MADVAAVPDAGVVEGTPPIARITSVVAGNCGTSVSVDGLTSEAFDGEVLQEYRWTLRDAKGLEIVAFKGAPTEALEAGIHSLGGTYGQPRLNFPPYEGYAVFEVDVVTSASESVYQEGLDLSGFDVAKLYFAGRFDSDEDTKTSVVNVEIWGNQNQVVYSSSEPIDENFSEFEFTFSLEGQTNVSNSTLVVSFGAAGMVWLDNIGLYAASDGIEVLENGSAETGNTSPWLYATGGPTQGNIKVLPTPQNLRETENYTLHLKVVDSRGLESAVERIDVVGTECLPEF